MSFNSIYISSVFWQDDRYVIYFGGVTPKSRPLGSLLFTLITTAEIINIFSNHVLPQDFLTQISRLNTSISRESAELSTEQFLFNR